jgi:DNA (cytosine-5)-methyltransferase 1
VTKRLLNAANYGVPQKRERVFIVALRDDINEKWLGAPESHSEDALIHDQWVSGVYWKRHKLRRPETPARLLGRVADLKQKGRPEGHAWLTVRDALEGLPEPMPRQETKGVLNHVGQPGARSYPGHTGSPLDEPAKTLKAGVHGVPGGENMLRRADGTVRYFTVREAARLQTFPDTYHVQGAWGEALRQLGNAVPMKLAEAVARSVGDILEPRLVPPPPRRRNAKTQAPVAV